MGSSAVSARTFAVLATLVTFWSVATGCGSSNAIVNHWIHSHEEDSTGVQTYRPSTYSFPPSRGREGWELRKDGTAVHDAIAPADGNDAFEGHWTLGDGGLLTITTSETPRPYRFNVLQVDSTILKLQVLR
jgi:hypothetical protein